MIGFEQFPSGMWCGNGRLCGGRGQIIENPFLSSPVSMGDQGVCGKVFQAVVVAVLPTIREIAG